MTQSERAQPSEKHVVCVDNSRDLLEMLCMLLEDEGYRASPLTFGPDTFDSIVSLRPDALIVDLAYNVHQSWNLLERLSGESNTRSVPKIVVSTDVRALEIVRRQSHRFRAERVLQKPFDVYELCSMVGEIIGPAIDESS